MRGKNEEERKTRAGLTIWTTEEFRGRWTHRKDCMTGTHRGHVGRGEVESEPQGRRTKATNP